MLVDLNDLPKCNCGIAFQEDDQLNKHTQEITQCRLLLKELIRFVEDQLERLPFHSRAQDIDDDADHALKKHQDEEGWYHCPRDCDFKGKKPFQLKKHFGRHIPLYNEPRCVYNCGNLAQTVGEYLDHAKLHTDSLDSEAKMVYLSSRCEELRRIRDEHLALSLPNITRLSTRKIKRKRKSAQHRPVDTIMSRPAPRTHIPDNVSLSSQLGPGAAAHSTALPTADVSVHRPGYVESGQPVSRNTISTSGAAMPQLNHHGSTQDMQTFSDMGLGLHSHESAGLEGNAFMTGANSHMPSQSMDSLSHHIGPEPPSARNAIGSDMSGYSSRIPAQHMDLQSQLGSGPLTTQSTNYSNAAVNMPDPSLPTEQATTRYVNADNLERVGTHYMNFGRIVGTLNFPYE